MQLIYMVTECLRCYLMMKLNFKKICLEEILNTPDDNETGYFIEVDLRYPDNIKENTKNSRFAQRRRKLYLINTIII